MSATPVAVVCLLAIVFVPHLEAQPHESELDALLNTRVSTAAKYEQTMSDAAASVTIVTAEEIARYGWHTLADALSALRGMYTTYDRNYSYLGIRGVGLPTDYNNRFLLLINGTPLHDNAFGSAFVDTGLALDLSHFARIELVRGPASVLYGTGAMFGVINLITKDEGETSSAIVGAGSGRLRTAAARTSFRRGELRGSIGGSWQEKDGGDLYFAEFDHPDTNRGIVRDHDADDYRSVLATLQWRDLRVVALHSSRTKLVPTASWQSVFGSDEWTTDGRTTLGIDARHRVDALRTIHVAAFYDRYDYSGAYPDTDDVFLDEQRSVRMGGELRYVWDLRPGHRLTLGGELIRNRSAEYSWRFGDSGGSIGEPFSTSAAYAQIESQVTPRLAITAGASVDRHPRVDTKLTPRAAAVFRAGPSSTFKALYGSAFRVPGTYELDYAGSDVLPSQDLKAESLRSWELVWEQRLGSNWLATLSAFDLSLQDVIRLEAAGNGTVQYQNHANVSSRGVELQFDHRTNDGIWSHASLTWSRTREDGSAMTNSPSRLIKAGISSPTARKWFGAADIQYESSRLTLANRSTGDVFLAHVNAGVALTKSLQLTTTIRNVFDTAYAQPGGPEHVQDALEQDGRTVLVRLRVGKR